MSNDKSEGFYRRMVIIPMLRKFGKDGQKKIHVIEQIDNAT